MSSVKLMPTVGLSLQEVKRKNLSSRPVGPARIREDPPTRSGEANENAAPVGASTVLSATVNGKRKHSARWARAFKRRQAEGGEQSQDETGSSRRGSKAEMGTDAEKHLDPLLQLMGGCILSRFLLALAVRGPLHRLRRGDPTSSRSC